MCHVAVCELLSLSSTKWEHLPESFCYFKLRFKKKICCIFLYCNHVFCYTSPIRKTKMLYLQNSLRCSLWCSQAPTKHLRQQSRSSMRHCYIQFQYESAERQIHLLLKTPILSDTLTFTMSRLKETLALKNSICRCSRRFIAIHAAESCRLRVRRTRAEILMMIQFHIVLEKQICCVRCCTTAKMLLFLTSRGEKLLGLSLVGAAVCFCSIKNCGKNEFRNCHMTGSFYCGFRA